MSLPEHSGHGWNFWRPQCSSWLVASISLSRSKILWTVGLFLVLVGVVVAVVVVVVVEGSLMLF